MMLVAKGTAAELRTKGLLSPSCLSRTPALRVASDVAMVLSASACKLYFLFKNVFSLSGTVLMSDAHSSEFSGDAMSSQPGKTTRSSLGWESTPIVRFSRVLFPPSPPPQPRCDLKTAHLAVWLQQKHFRSLGQWWLCTFR